VQDRHHAGQTFQDRLGRHRVAPVTLTYEAGVPRPPRRASANTAAGIGGDPVKGTEFIVVLEKCFLADPKTTSIIMIGENRRFCRGGRRQFIKDEAKRGRKKPMVGFIAASPPLRPPHGPCRRYQSPAARRRRFQDRGDGKQPELPFPRRQLGSGIPLPKN